MTRKKEEKTSLPAICLNKKSENKNNLVKEET